MCALPISLKQRIAYLEEGDWVVITRDKVSIYDRNDKPVDRPITVSGVTGALIDKGNHRHFMQKEIFEQPVVVAQRSDERSVGQECVSTCRSRVSPNN